MAESLEAVLAYVSGSDAPLAPFVYVFFVVTTLLCLPASTQALFIGAAFGFVEGMGLMSLGTVTGAVIARLVGMGPLGQRVRQWIDRQPRLGALRGAIEDGGWRLAFLARLTPAAPLGLSHWLFSVVGLPLRTHVLVAGIATLPSQAMWVHLGATGRSSWEHYQTEHGLPLIRWLFLGSSVFLTVAVTVVVGRLTDRRLKAALNQSEIEAPLAVR